MRWQLAKSIKFFYICHILGKKTLCLINQIYMIKKKSSIWPHLARWINHLHQAFQKHSWYKESYAVNFFIPPPPSVPTEREREVVGRVWWASLSSPVMEGFWKGSGGRYESCGKTRILRQPPVFRWHKCLRLCSLGKAAFNYGLMMNWNDSFVPNNFCS